MSLGVIGSAAIIPLVKDGDLSIIFEERTWIWIVFGFALHFVAHGVLGLLKEE